jgi:hypothetical protein
VTAWAVLWEVYLAEQLEQQERGETLSPQPLGFPQQTQKLLDLDLLPLEQQQQHKSQKRWSKQEYSLVTEHLAQRTSNQGTLVMKRWELTEMKLPFLQQNLPKSWGWFDLVALQQ